VAETGVEIVGFQYPGGYLPYLGGMLAIYGQNGAGKSLLLESIESSLSGRLAGRTQPSAFDYMDRITSAAVVRARFSNLSAYYDREADEGTTERFRSALELADADVSNLRLPAGLAAAWAELHRELSDENVAVIAPAGSIESRWTAFAAISPESPKTVQWVSELEDHIATFANGDEAADPDAGYDKWYESTEEEWTLETYVTNLDGTIQSRGIFRFNGMTQPMFVSPFGTVITDDSADPEAAVARWIERALWEERRSEDRAGPEQVVERLATTGIGWTRRANDLLQRFLLDPPPLRLVLGDPLDWVSGSGPHWEAGPAVPINSLSDAEKRWSRIAIALAAPHDESVLLNSDSDDAGTFAIDEDSDLPAPILLLDEPERGLHRAAEAHLASGLLALTSTKRVRPIIATHSPSLLDAGQGQIVQIKKREAGGIGELTELTATEIEELKSFGLQPSSLLHLDRGYLLVEGLHDKQILEGWFAEELQSKRVAILAMHGATNLENVFNSEFLIERSDALLMPLLDDIAIEPLHDIWARAEAKVLDGRRSDAANIIFREIGKVPGGAKNYYGPLLIGAVRNGVSQRFFPLGMSKKDVLEYLPAGELVEGATSWGDLRKEWTRSPAAMADRSGKSYKKWLRGKGADLSPENLRLIAETTAPHPELKAIVAKISARLG